MAAVCMWHETLDQAEITRRNAGFPAAGVVVRACAVAGSASCAAQTSSRHAPQSGLRHRAATPQSRRIAISEFMCCVVPKLIVQ